MLNVCKEHYLRIEIFHEHVEINSIKKYNSYKLWNLGHANIKSRSQKHEIKVTQTWNLGHTNTKSRSHKHEIEVTQTRNQANTSMKSRSHTNEIKVTQTRNQGHTNKIKVTQTWNQSHTNMKLSMYRTDLTLFYTCCGIYNLILAHFPK